MALDNVRSKIDQLDYEIVKLLEARFERAAITRKLKKDVDDPQREKEVLDNVTRYPGTLIEREFAKKMFLQIMEESKRIQKEDRKLVAFQGEHGAYSEMAVRELFEGAISIPCPDFAQVFSMVQNGQSDFGVVPVENTLGGPVSEVNDLLATTDLVVVGEFELPVHHCLLALPGTDHHEIRAVYSHWQALAQCAGFIGRNKLERRPYYDTAGAAKMLAAERPAGCAVIASPLCAALYNLDVLKKDIEDVRANATRFFVVGRQPQWEKGADKGSVVFATKDEAGALYRILGVFSDAKINLTRIESRPSRQTLGRYLFLVDFQGGPADKRVQEALVRVEQEAATFRLLGFYRENGGKKPAAGAKK